MSPRSRRSDTSWIAVDRLALATDDEPLRHVLDEEGGHGGSVEGRARRRAVGPGDLLLSEQVAVTVVTPGDVRAVGVGSVLAGSGGRKSNEPRIRFDARRIGWARGSGDGSPRRGIKKAGGPSGPRLVVRLGAAYRLRLARDGHRSPADGGAIGRGRRPEEQEIHLHWRASQLDEWRAVAAPAGSLARRGGASTLRMTVSATRQMT